MEFSLVGSNLATPRSTKMVPPSLRDNILFRNDSMNATSQQWRVQNDQQLVVQMYSHVKSQRKGNKNTSSEEKKEEKKFRGFKKSYRMSNSEQNRALGGTRFTTIPPILCRYVPKGLRLSGLPAVATDAEHTKCFPDGMLANNTVGSAASNPEATQEQSSLEDVQPKSASAKPSTQNNTDKNNNPSTSHPNSNELKLSLKTLSPPVAPQKRGNLSYRSDLNQVPTDYTFDWVASRNANYGFQTVRGPGRVQINFNTSKGSSRSRESKKSKIHWEHSKDSLTARRQLTMLNIDGSNL